MYLTKPDLLRALAAGELRFVTDDERDLYPVPFNELTAVQDVSVDLRLGFRFWLLPGTTYDADSKTIKRAPLEAGEAITIRPLSKERAEGYFQQHIIKERVCIGPLAFLQGETYERVDLGASLHAFIEGRSSLARHGLIVHCTAPHIEPHWNKRIRLEIFNHTGVNIELIPGETGICQLLVDRIGRAPRRQSAPRKQQRPARRR